MTGFGSARGTAGSEEIAVEIKSVNGKFCDVKVRVPRELNAFEAVASKLVKDRLARGSIEVTVRRNRVSTGLVPVVDVELAREFQRALTEIAQAVGLAEGPGLREIASQPGVLRMEEPGVNTDEANRAALDALHQALGQLISMREVEGAALRTDLNTRLDVLQSTLGEIKRLSTVSVQVYQQRLQDRIGELTQGLSIDPQRLAQEVAVFADRTDVTEEMTRFESHVAQFRALLVGDEPSGRKLEFLVQELNREINTTGSKSQHAEIAQRVVTIKTELERIREQVANVE